MTVYRLICKGTIEERILQRAREKSEIQRMVIQGGSFKGFNKPGELKPKEVVSLLLDDEELERKYNVQATCTSNNPEPKIMQSEDSNVDVESSIDGWMSSDELYEMMESSSVCTSMNTTRAPSPTIEVKEEQPVTDTVEAIEEKAFNAYAIPTLLTGRSKRPMSAKRPPKRFDD